MFMNPDRDTDSQQLASGFLSRAGFTGIDYPAECSTGGRADGARNYVIFSEADLKITAHERSASSERRASDLTGLKGPPAAGEPCRRPRNGKVRQGCRNNKDGDRLGTRADSKWRYETADFEYHPAGDLGYSTPAGETVLAWGV